MIQKQVDRGGRADDKGKAGEKLPLSEPHAGPKTVGERLEVFNRLMTAIRGGKGDDVKKAVAEGADLKANDEQGLTPLQAAEFELARANNMLDDAMTPGIGGVVEMCAIIVENRNKPPVRLEAPRRSPAKLIEEAIGEVSVRREIVEFLKQNGAE